MTPGADPRRSKTQRIAASMPVSPARPAPRSERGRSETTSSGPGTAGRRQLPGRDGLQAPVGRWARRATRAPATVTQTAPAPAASPVARRHGDPGADGPARGVHTDDRATAGSSTHTAPSPTAIRVGRPPTGSWRSPRQTRVDAADSPGDASATQDEPKPTVSADGPATRPPGESAIGIGANAGRVAGSRRSTLSSAALAAHSAPAPHEPVGGPASRRARRAAPFAGWIRDAQAAAECR